MTKLPLIKKSNLYSRHSRFIFENKPNSAVTNGAISPFGKNYYPENSPIRNWLSFPEIGLVHETYESKIEISKKRMSFPVRRKTEISEKILDKFSRIY